MKNYKNFDEHNEFESLRKFEKIRKGQRSKRGRTFDDWFIEDTLTKEELKIFQKSPYNFVLKHFKNKDRNEDVRLGRVIEVQKRHMFIAEEEPDGLPDTGLLWFCSIAKRHFQRKHGERNFVVVGDRVLFRPGQEEVLDEEGQPLNEDLPRGLIEHSLKRVHYFSRQDALNLEWEHVLFSHIDKLLIVASVFYPEVRWGLIDRMLIQAEAQKIEPIIILNKVDLLENKKLATPAFMKRYEERISFYRKIGYQVFEISVLKKDKYKKEILKLSRSFKDKIVGFCGHSGVGKSSLLNLMGPEFEQVVDDNPEIFYKGRHTTTYNSFLALENGGFIIDSPGIRSFAIPSRKSSELTPLFPEMRDLVCRFSECSHEGEPGCAVKAALEQGEIYEGRYRSLIGILKGISFREGEGGDASEAELIAEFKACEQMRIQQEEEKKIALVLKSSKKEKSTLKKVVLQKKVKDTKVKDTKVKDTKVKDTKVKDTKVKDTKVKDTKKEKIKV